VHFGYPPNPTDMPQLVGRELVTPEEAEELAGGMAPPHISVGIKIIKRRILYQHYGSVDTY